MSGARCPATGGTLGGRITTAIGDIASKIGQTLADLGGAIGGAIGSALGSVGAFLGPIGAAVGGILDTVGGLIDSIFGPSETAQHNQQIRDAINEMFREAVVLGQVEGVPATIEGFHDLDDEIRNVGVKLKDSGISAQTAIQAVADNFDFLVKQFEGGASVQDATNALLDKIKDDLEETEAGLASVTRNLPTGFKTALARFDATIAESLGRLGQVGRALDGGGIRGPTLGTNFEPAATYSGDIHITMNVDGNVNPRELLNGIERELEHRRLRGGGGLRVSSGSNVPPFL